MPHRHRHVGQVVEVLEAAQVADHGVGAAGADHGHRLPLAEVVGGLVVERPQRLWGVAVGVQAADPRGRPRPLRDGEALQGVEADHRDDAEARRHRRAPVVGHEVDALRSIGAQGRGEEAVELGDAARGLHVGAGRVDVGDGQASSLQPALNGPVARGGDPEPVRHLGGGEEPVVEGARRLVEGVEEGELAGRVGGREPDADAHLGERRGKPERSEPVESGEDVRGERRTRGQARGRHRGAEAGGPREQEAGGDGDRPGAMGDAVGHPELLPWGERRPAPLPCRRRSSDTAILPSPQGRPQSRGRG